MSAKQGRQPRRIAPFTERENMERDLKTMERDENGESSEFSRSAKKMFSQEIEGRKSVNRQQINRLKRALANSQPEPLSKAEIVELENEEKVLTEHVQKMMLPKKHTTLKQYDSTGFSTEFRKASNHMAANEFSKDYLRKAHRLKNIRRQLRPNDPDAGNLEFIRPD